MGQVIQIRSEEVCDVIKKLTSTNQKMTSDRKRKHLTCLYNKNISSYISISMEQILQIKNKKEGHKFKKEKKVKWKCYQKLKR